jgi:hypothetical protein
MATGDRLLGLLRHGPPSAAVGHSPGRGQSANIPTAAAASTARCHASAGVVPWTLEDALCRFLTRPGSGERRCARPERPPRRFVL